jgi:23S rRNA (pseudouridine1915-N3)-methyltransferase
MRLHLIAVGTNMPDWVRQGYDEYSRRMPAECSLQLKEIQAGHRGKGADIKRAVRDEAERMLAAIPTGCRVVCLEVEGRQWSTEELAEELQRWMVDGRDVALLVGGPEGLAQEVRDKAEQRWSLSALTLPHPLVRVVIAEQLYRALSVIKGHPYHRQ